MKSHSQYPQIIKFFSDETGKAEWNSVSADWTPQLRHREGLLGFIWWYFKPLDKKFCRYGFERR